jgi:uncharacterized secreted protein with C-terminal beta-propeller domain
MRSFKRLNLILFFVLAFCCSIVTAESGKTPVDVSKRSSRDDFSVTRIPNVEIQNDHVIHKYVSEPHSSPKVQQTENHAIKLYSNDWWGKY